jgi:hypothetical protein
MVEVEAVVVDSVAVAAISVVAAAVTSVAAATLAMVVLASSIAEEWVSLIPARNTPERWGRILFIEHPVHSEGSVRQSTVR